MARAFSSCGEWELAFVVVRRLLLWQSTGSTARWPRQPLHMGSAVVGHRVSCLWHVGSSQTRNRTPVPCNGRRILHSLRHQGCSIHTFSTPPLMSFKGQLHLIRLNYTFKSVYIIKINCIFTYFTILTAFKITTKKVHYSQKKKKSQQLTEIPCS